jgi:hypothetical protein
MGVQQIVVLDSNDLVPHSITGSAPTLTTSRNIAFSGGDVTGTGAFNGSADTAIDLTIVANAIRTAMIGDLQVTTGKLPDDAVTAAKLASASVVPVSLSGLADNGTAGQYVITDGDGTWSYRTDNMYDINAMANKDADLATADEIPYYDSANSVHRTMTLTDLATYQASGTNSGIGNSGGLLKLDVSGLAEVTALNKADSFMIIDASDSNATKKKSLGHLATMFAGTGLTATDSVIAVNTTQNIGSITGQGSLGINSNTAITGNLTLTGDLTVSGKTITTTTETLEIADNLIHLNSDLGSNAGVDTGIVAERGTTGDNACLFWDHSKSAWATGTKDTVAFPETSVPLMLAKTKAGVPTDSDANVGDMIYDTTNNNMYIRTS